MTYLPSSGSLSMNTIRNHTSDGAGWRNIIPNGASYTLVYPMPQYGDYNLDFYRGRRRWLGPSGILQSFPTGAIGFADFRSMAPMYPGWTGGGGGGGE